MIKVTDATQIPAALRTMRFATGATQRELATRSGFRQSQIGSWETGDRTPATVSLLHVANACGYDLVLVPREDA